MNDTAKNTSFRIEKDSMGEMQVADSAYYGAQTQRAVLNFPISHHRLPSIMIKALAYVKCAAAQANLALGKVEKNKAQAIIQAASEIIEGQLNDQFVVDIYQTGSGTSSNMNTNEVLANRATEILGGEKGSKLVHPNDHVNYGQSSNDVFPTAMHVATHLHLQNNLLPSLRHLHKSLDEKAQAFGDIVKIGRTHLQDATPIRMGQVFSGYAFQVQEAIERIERALISISELPLGGTAVGTGLNTDSQFPKMAIANISKLTGIRFSETRNHFAAQANKDAIVEISSSMRNLAVSLMKIANDIRLLGSGPRCGLGELILPETQPGSSIMPGKVNPVIAESVCMVCATVMGNDAAVAVGGQAGNFELNVMMPMMIHHVLDSSELLSKVSVNFADKCIDGLKVDEKRCQELIEQSLAMCTSLAPLIGYDEAAAIAKDAFKSNRTVRQVSIEKNVLSEDKLNVALDAKRMTSPDQV